MFQYSCSGFNTKTIISFAVKVHPHLRNKKLFIFRDQNFYFWADIGIDIKSSKFLYEYYHRLRYNIFPFNHLSMSKYPSNKKIIRIEIWNHILL